MKGSVVVIGGGYAGLSSACHLAQKGYNVKVVDKLSQVGGRNRELKTKEGFTFELGPSWLWMKDVHEQFYRSLDRNMDDYVKFVEINPAYRVFFEDCTVNVPSGQEAFGRMLESLEIGARSTFDAMFALDEFKYNIALTDFIALPSLHFGEYLLRASVRYLFYMGLFTSQHAFVKSRFKVSTKSSKAVNFLNSSNFKDRRVQTLLEWPVIFVGSSPKRIPALYRLVFVFISEKSLCLMASAVFLMKYIELLSDSWQNLDCSWRGL